jgi:hypothetical protein
MMLIELVEENMIFPVESNCRLTLPLVAEFLFKNPKIIGPAFYMLAICSDNPVGPICFHLMPCNTSLDELSQFQKKIMLKLLNIKLLNIKIIYRIISICCLMDRGKTYFHLFTFTINKNINHA